MKNAIMLILNACLISLGYSQVLVKRPVTLMGSAFEISIVEQDTAAAERYIDEVVAEMERIEDLLSEWRPYTQISQVNLYAGIRPVQVDREVFDLTARALDYSRMSGGAFDISIAALDRIWRFDGSMTVMPTADAIKKSIEYVGFEHIVLDSAASTIYLDRKGMKIGFGSIGKGYAADRGRALMKQRGAKGGIVNAAGDLSTWGNPPGRHDWQVGINNPFKQKLLKVLKLREASVATSGSYEKYAEIDGKRYAHIIDPKTGYPAQGLTSVTVYGPSAEFANALSTSVMVLGPKDGIRLIKQFPAYRYVLITDKGKVIK